MEAIFPLDPAQGNLRDAAWQPYIVLCRPYTGAFQLLRKQYEHAIRDIERKIAYQVAGNADHREQLAEHLIILYGRGCCTEMEIGQMRQSRCFRMLMGCLGCVAATHMVFTAPGCGAIDLGAVFGKDACIYFNCDTFFLAAPTDDHDDMDDMGDGEEHEH